MTFINNMLFLCFERRTGWMCSPSFCLNIHENGWFVHSNAYGRVVYWFLETNGEQIIQEGEISNERCLMEEGS